MMSTPFDDTSHGDVTYEAAGRRYIGTLVAADAVPRALAVLLPDWRGRSHLALEHAAHLAGLGCTTLVADLYGNGFNPTDPDQVAPMVQHLLGHRAEGAAALSAAIAAVRESAGRPEHPVIVVAFSAGAVAALDHGRRTKEAAAIVVCSGLLRTAEPGTSTLISAPVLLLQGTQDEVSPIAVVTSLIEEADAAGSDLRVTLLSQTHHAFDNPEASTDPAGRLVYSSRSATRAALAIAGIVDEVAASDQTA